MVRYPIICTHTKSKIAPKVTPIKRNRKNNNESSVIGFFSRNFEIIIFCFVVAICDLVHDVETIFHLSYVLTASGNLF